MRRIVCTSSSSNDWVVLIVALIGFEALFAAVRSCANMICEPAIIPIAKTPTAIDSTTRMVRVLLLHRSPNTLRQRGLSMSHLPLAHGGIFRDALLGHLADRCSRQLRLGQQLVEGRAVECRHLDRHVGGAHTGDAGATAQKPDLAEILARVHCRDGDILPTGVVQ